MSVEDELKEIQREIALLKRENDELRQDINYERRRRVKFMKNVGNMFDKYANMNTRYSKAIWNCIEDEKIDEMYNKLYKKCDERMKMINNVQDDDITFLLSSENEGFKSDTDSVYTLMERINKPVLAIEAPREEPREVQMIEAPKQRLMLEAPKEILRIEPPKHVIKKEMNLIKKEMDIIPFRENIFPFNNNRMEED